MLKPKAEQIFDMDGTGKEAHKKIKMTGMETNKVGNIFRGIQVTTECFKQVCDMYKKVVCDPFHSNAYHNIIVYRFRKQFGAGCKLVKMMQTLQVYNMTIVILRFYAKHRCL